MTDKKNTTVRDNGKLPFPYDANRPCNNPQALEVASVIVDTMKDLNNTLASAGNVHYFVRAHYTDISTGTYGIARLIENILRANGACFPKNVASTEFRKVAIATAMFTQDIINEVRTTAGFDRYPDKTIRDNLCTVLLKRKGTVQVIKLSNAEDNGRPCDRPRAKYFLIEG